MASFSAFQLLLFLFLDISLSSLVCIVDDPVT